MKTRLDKTEERKQFIKEKTEERQKLYNSFMETGRKVLKNKETSKFFDLAFKLYGEEVFNNIQVASNITEAERNNAIGQFNLLYKLVMPFIGSSIFK